MYICMAYFSNGIYKLNFPTRLLCSRRIRSHRAHQTPQVPQEHRAQMLGHDPQLLARYSGMRELDDALDAALGYLVVKHGGVILYVHRHNWAVVC